MKRVFACLLIFCLFLSACQPRTGGRGSQPEGESEPLSDSSRSSSTGSGPEEPDESDESEPEESEPDQGEGVGFYENVILVYGAEFVSGGREIGLMQAGLTSLFYIDDWSDPMEIEAGTFYGWYLSMMWKEDLTNEERREKYKSPRPEDEGWFFPQDLYEAKILEYFDVTVEHLRSERLIYDPELEGYYLETGGGAGERPAVSIDKVEESGDTATIRVRLRSQDSVEAPSQYKVITVKLLPDGGFRFLSCKTE